MKEQPKRDFVYVIKFYKILSNDLKNEETTEQRIDLRLYKSEGRWGT